MVFFGGSKQGLKDAEGKIPPIKINALKSTIATHLKNAPTVMAQLGESPEELLELLDRYWMAVRDTFPTEWGNRTDYILLQSIGLGGFAKYGGVVLERAVDAGAVEYDDLVHHLRPLVDAVSLARSSPEWTGVAGAGGADLVAKRLIDAADTDTVKKQQLIKKLGGLEDTTTSLD